MHYSTDAFDMLKAAINSNSRLVIRRNADCSVSIRLYSRDDTFFMVTDTYRDGLSFAADFFTPAAAGGTIFAARDFSLNRYDLTTDAGLRAAREYVRRKLTAFAAGTITPDEPNRAELVRRFGAALGNRLFDVLSSAYSTSQVDPLFFSIELTSDSSSELDDSTLTSESSGTLRNFHSKNSAGRTPSNA